MKFNRLRQDQAPEEPEFPTVDVAYAKKILAAKKKRKGGKLSVALEDED